MKEGDKSPSIRHREQWTQRGGVPFKQVLKKDTFKGTYTATYSAFWELPLFVRTNIHKNSYRLYKGSQSNRDLNFKVLLFPPQLRKRLFFLPFAQFTWKKIRRNRQRLCRQMRKRQI